jgi:vacuolar-type H+-ATPase subunit H
VTDTASPGFINPGAALQVLKNEIEGVHRHYDRDAATLQQQLVEIDKRYNVQVENLQAEMDRRFLDGAILSTERVQAIEEAMELRQQAIDQRFTDSDKAVQAALQGADKAVQAALQAAKEAVTKAETAAEKRFDSTNEFRGQLADQANTFMPRAEAEIRLTNLAESQATAVATLTSSIQKNTDSISSSGGGKAENNRLTAMYVSLGVGGLGVVTAIVIAIISLGHHP